MGKGGGGGERSSKVGPPSGSLVGLSLTMAVKDSEEEGIGSIEILIDNPAILYVEKWQ